MEKKNGPSVILRSIAIVLMALTVLFTLMGGIGTTCVAFGAEKYDSMKGLVPYKPLYQSLVFISVAAGVWGIFIIVKLVRGGVHLYRNTVIMLVIGAVTSGIQTAVSQSVRGSSAPVNMRFYITVFTLIVFLIFRIPSIWNRLQFDKSLKNKSSNTASGSAFFICGVITLSTYLWTNATHTTAWIDVMRLPILAGGLVMVICGITLLFRVLALSVLKQYKNTIYTAGTHVVD
jgi:hypothetical protein